MRPERPNVIRWEEEPLKFFRFTAIENNRVGVIRGNVKKRGVSLGSIGPVAPKIMAMSLGQEILRDRGGGAPVKENPNVGRFLTGSLAMGIRKCGQQKPDAR